jgi:hypothetical protein
VTLLKVTEILWLSRKGGNIAKTRSMGVSVIS